MDLEVALWFRFSFFLEICLKNAHAFSLYVFFETKFLKTFEILQSQLPCGFAPFEVRKISIYGEIILGSFLRKVRFFYFKGEGNL